MGDAVAQIQPGGSVDRDHREVQVRQARQQRGRLLPRRAPGPGAQDRIHQKPETGPGPVGRDLPNAGLPRRASDLGIEVGSLTWQGGNPHRRAERVQRPRQDPAVAPVVAGAARHQHALPERRRQPRRQHRRGASARRLHQGGHGDAGLPGQAVPLGRLFGRQDWNHDGVRSER